MDTLQQLHDSRIAFDISAFSPNQFHWVLWGVDRGTTNSMSEAVDALADAAIRHYPDSEFARLRKRGKV